MTAPCTSFTSWLVRAAEDRLAPPEQAQLDAHLTSCDACRQALADQRSVRMLLQTHPVDGAPLGFDTRVMAAIAAEAERRHSSWFDSLDYRRWTWRLLPVAAALALVIAAVTPTDAASPSVENTGTTLAQSTDNLPVSAALWSESVSESSLLSLMLSAGADDALADHRTDLADGSTTPITPVRKDQQ